MNLVESLEGRGRLIHVVPALLESLELPFTGCSASALGITSHKVLAKRQLRAAGIPTPAHVRGNRRERDDATAAHGS